MGRSVIYLLRLQVVFAVVSFGSLVLTVNVVLLVRYHTLTMQMYLRLAAL